MENPSTKFESAIRGKDKISVIAEVKKRSPAGRSENGRVFNAHSTADLVAAYNAGGASAISVVTDPYRFNGSIKLLEQVKKSTNLPVLRKDFIQTVTEVDEGYYAGADATLLIAKDLSKRQLHDLIDRIHVRAMSALVEVYDARDLAKLAGRDDVVIGINNRNLKTLRTNFGHALGVLNKVDPELTIIAESAFSDAGQLQPYKGRVDAALIGSSLLTAENPQKKLESFL
jgi:indole-3-glycerol phosphate synthase